METDAVARVDVVTIRGTDPHILEKTCRPCKRDMSLGLEAVSAITEISTRSPDLNPGTWC